MKIAIPEKNAVSIDDISLDHFSSLGDFTEYKNTSNSQIVERCKDLDAVLCNKTLFDESIFSQCPKLKYIGVCATGYNNIDLVSAKAHNITVTNVPEYSTNAVAQQVFAYILHFTNRVNRYDQSVRNGDWINSENFCYFPFPITELTDKTLGIIGYGNIGKKVGEIAKVFGMKVIVSTRTPKVDNTVEFCSLDDVLANSDFLTIHCPLTDITRGMMNAEMLNKMKKSSVLINTSRGPIVNEKDLRDALIKEQIRGAAVDVIEVEPMNPDCPLLTAPNCIITPHVAWAGKQTRERLMDVVFNNLQSFINGAPHNVVNNI